MILINITKASELLGVSTKTLRDWDKNNKLKPIRTVGNHRRYKLSDIKAFLGETDTIDDDIETIECRICHQFKTVECFYSGNKYWCKQCHSLRAKNNYHDSQYYQKNKERFIVRNREWKENNKDRVKQHAAKRRYGIGKDQFAEMQVKAGGKCAICKQLTKKLCIDHNHKTGLVRELLCPACNHGIGNFKEDIQLLEAAIEYLKKF